MRNLLDKLPKKEHGEATQRLRAIQRASSRSAAEKLARQLICVPAVNRRDNGDCAPASFGKAA
jgi:hypothetical protein